MLKIAMTAFSSTIRKTRAFQIADQFSNVPRHGRLSPFYAIITGGATYVLRTFPDGSTLDLRSHGLAWSPRPQFSE